MIKLSEGGIADMWTQNTTPEIQALSYALQNAIAKVEAYVAKTKCYADVDSLDEETLDYFAVEQRSMFYDQSMTIEQKRKIIKNTLNWYTKAGTPSSVAEMVAVIFGDGTVVEWFDFIESEGEIEPYTFDIMVPTDIQDSEEYMATIAAIISRVKNVRSHLRRVLFSRTPSTALAVAAHPWSFAVITVRNDYEKTVASDTTPSAGVEPERYSNVTVTNGFDKETSLDTTPSAGVEPERYSNVTVTNGFDKETSLDVSPSAGTETESLWREYTISATS